MLAGELAVQYMVFLVLLTDDLGKFENVENCGVLRAKPPNPSAWFTDTDWSTIFLTNVPFKILWESKI